MKSRLSSLCCTLALCIILSSFNCTLSNDPSTKKALPEVSHLASALQDFAYNIPTPYNAFLKGDLEQFKKLLTEETAQAKVQPAASLTEKNPDIEPQPLFAMLMAHHNTETRATQRYLPFFEHIINVLPAPQTSKEEEQLTPVKQLLIAAIFKSDTGVFKKIIQKYPALKKEPLVKGTPAIHLAAGVGAIEIMEFLVAQDQNQLDLKGAENITPLHAAAEEGQKEAVERLLEKQPDLLEVENDRKQTPLSVAVENCKGNRCEEVVQLLLDKGANPNLKTESGNEYILNNAVDNKEVAIAKQLLKHEKIAQEAIDAVDLHKAAATCDLELIQILQDKMDQTTFRQKINQEKGNPRAQTPYDLVTERCSGDEQQAELQKLLDPNPPKK